MNIPESITIERDPSIKLFEEEPEKKNDDLDLLKNIKKELSDVEKKTGIINFKNFLGKFKITDLKKFRKKLLQFSAAFVGGVIPLTALMAAIVLINKELENREKK